eukprot:Nk52_evm32s2612 gene=Nk52_evmTU32s2612
MTDYIEKSKKEIKQRLKRGEALATTLAKYTEVDAQDKRFHCNIASCPRSFSSPQSLAKHIGTHKGYAPFLSGGRRAYSATYSKQKSKVSKSPQGNSGRRDKENEDSATEYDTENSESPKSYKWKNDNMKIELKSKSNKNVDPKKESKKLSKKKSDDNNKSLSDVVETEMKVYENRLDSLMTEVDSIRCDMKKLSCDNGGDPQLQTERSFKTANEEDTLPGILTEKKQNVKLREQEESGCKKRPGQTKIGKRNIRSDFKDFESTNMEEEIVYEHYSDASNDECLTMNSTFSKQPKTRMSFDAATKIHELKFENSHLQCSVKKLQEELKEFREREVSLKRASEALESKVNEKEETIRELKSKLQRSLQDIDLMSAKVEGISALKDLQMEQQAEVNNRNEIFSEQIKNLRKNLESSRSALEAKLKEKEKECSLKDSMIEKLNEQIESSYHELNEFKLLSTKEIAEIKEQCNNEVCSVKQKLASDIAELCEGEESAKHKLNIEKKYYEESIEQLRAQILDLKKDIGLKTVSIEGYQAEVSAAMREKSQLEVELRCVRKQNQDYEQTLDNVKGSSRNAQDTMSSQVNEKIAECTKLQLELERVKTAYERAEDKYRTNERVSSAKLETAQSEITKLNSSIMQQEVLVSSLKESIEKHAHEAQEAKAKVSLLEHDINRIKIQSESEIERTKTQMKARITELQKFEERYLSCERETLTLQAKLKEFESKDCNSTEHIIELRSQQESWKFEKKEMGTRLEYLQEENKVLTAHNAECNARLEDSFRTADRITAELNSVKGRAEKLESDFQTANRERIELRAHVDEVTVSCKSQILKERQTMQDKEVELERKVKNLTEELHRAENNLHRLESSKQEAIKKLQNEIWSLREQVEKAFNANRNLQTFVRSIQNSYQSLF